MSDIIKKVETRNAPAAIGPYSQGVIAGNTLYVSGQLPINPLTKKIVEGGIKEQTSRVLLNIKGILEEAGCDFNRVVRCDVFLSDMNNFSDMNAVYGEYFRGDIKPARQAVEVSRLPKDVLIEISCIAVL